jgi:DNA-directed RNA polymerase specialized sigma24 family protein
MNNKLLAADFLNYVNINYNKLLSGFQKSSYKDLLTDDVFQDSIIKVYDSIIKKGFVFKPDVFSGKSFENYLFIVCGNEVLSRKKFESKNIKVNIDTPHDLDVITMDDPEYCYELDDELNKEIERISEDILVDEIFQFCKSHHSHLDCGIFEFYFRSGLGYRPLAEITGFSFRTIFVKINRVKTSIIENFQHKRLNHRIKLK